MLPILRQQAYAVDSRDAGYGDNVGHVLEVDVIVGFDESDAFDANRKDVAQAASQVVPRHYFFVDLHL